MSPPAQQIIGAALLSQHSSRYFLQCVVTLSIFQNLCKNPSLEKNETAQWNEKKKKPRVFFILYYFTKLDSRVNLTAGKKRRLVRSTLIERDRRRIQVPRQSLDTPFDFDDISAREWALYYRNGEPNWLELSQWKIRGRKLELVIGYAARWTNYVILVHDALVEGWVVLIARVWKRGFTDYWISVCIILWWSRFLG